MANDDTRYELESSHLLKSHKGDDKKNKKKLGGGDTKSERDLRALKHSADSVRDLAAFKTERPYAYGRMMSRLSRKIGRKRANQLAQSVQARIEQTRKSSEQSVPLSVADIAKAPTFDKAYKIAVQVVTERAAREEANHPKVASAHRLASASDSANQKFSKRNAIRPVITYNATKATHTGGGKKIGSSSNRSSGGAISLPKLGGGAPTALAPKGEGGGDSTIDAFANSGLSYQITSYGALGAKVDDEVAKKHQEVDARLPGKEDTPIAEASKNQKLDADTTALKATNDAISGDGLTSPSQPNPDALASQASAQIEAQEASYDENAEDIPDKPDVDSVGQDGVEAARHDEAQQLQSAQTEGKAKAAELDLTIPQRGFDDIHAEKQKFDEKTASLKTGAVSMESQVGALTEEAKGLLDITEIADSVSSDMVSVKSQAKSADEKQKADIDQKIVEHDQDVETEKQKAQDEEREALTSGKTDIDSELQTQSEGYEKELAQYDSKQQADIDAAHQELEEERKTAQHNIDQEHAKAQKDKESAEKEGKEKKDKNLFEKAVDVGKACWNWLKSKVSAIVGALVGFIKKALNAFASAVKRIVKTVVQKIKDGFAKFKQFLTDFLKALKDAIAKLVDAIVKAIKAIVEAIVEAIKAIGKALLDAIKAVWEFYRTLLRGLLSLVSQLLAKAAMFFMEIIKKACETIGVDGGFLDSAMAAAQKIIENPGGFADAMIHGVIGGFKQFGANIVQNVIAIFKNLVNLWLGAIGVSLPGEFNVPNLIKLAFDIIGIDVDKILSTLGNIQKGATEVWEFASAVKKGGVKAVVPYITDQFKGMEAEIRNEFIKTIVEKAATAALTKLASMATPATGILTAIKAVWDMVQFVRENMSAIGGLVSAIGGLIASAANGDSSAVSNAVEATLCQAIPLVIDLFLRIAGINVGAKVEKVVGKLRARVKKVFDSFIGKLRKSNNALVRKAGNQVKTSDEKEKDKKKKEDAEKEKNDRQDKARHDAYVSGAKSKNVLTRGASNLGLQGERLAGALNKTKDWQDGFAFDPTKMTGALKGEKEGDLGIDLDKSKIVNAIDAYHEQKRDKAQKEKVKAYQSQQKNALDAKLEIVTSSDGKVDTSKLSKSELKAYRKRLAEQEEVRRDADNGVLVKKEEEAVEKDLTLREFFDEDRKERQEKKAKEKAIKQAQKAEEKRYRKEGHSRADAEIRRNVMANLQENQRSRFAVESAEKYEKYRQKCQSQGKKAMPMPEYTQRLKNLEKANAAKVAYSKGESRETFNEQYDRMTSPDLWNPAKKHTKTSNGWEKHIAGMFADAVVSEALNETQNVQVKPTRIKADGFSVIQTEQEQRFTPSITSPNTTSKAPKKRRKHKYDDMDLDMDVRGKTSKVYPRNMEERRKFLLMEAENPNSILTSKQKDEIKASNGYHPPKDYEVSHKKPRYVATTLRKLINLDSSNNMEILKKEDHRLLHKYCGNTYHKYGPSNKPKYEMENIDEE